MAASSWCRKKPAPSSAVSAPSRSARIAHAPFAPSARSAAERPRPSRFPPRLAEAKGQSIPPYVIFHDSVLRDIAAQRPQTLDELAQIKGVGASKLDRYGRHVLGVLTAQLPIGLTKRW
jgi:ATP-dependent DNA helicase RecQ